MLSPDLGLASWAFLILLGLALLSCFVIFGIALIDHVRDVRAHRRDQS
jgi:hypothetical protein